MSEKPTKVIYLSTTESGIKLLGWLQSLHCDVVLAETNGKKIVEFPPYDLGLSFLYAHRIPASEFAEPFKWVNFHPGPLPEFRGRNIAYHAILEQVSHFGATIHYMDVEFDTGEIIEVSRFPIKPEDTAGDLVQLAHEKLVELFRKHIPDLLRGKVPSQLQPENGRYYCRMPIDNTVELTQEQRTKIRALTVHPRFYAETTIGGRKYQILPVEDNRIEQV